MKRLITGILLMTAMLSCVKEGILNDQDGSGLVAMTFIADLVGETKTSLVDGRKVHWTAGDRISVFAESDGSNRMFSAASVNGSIAEFSGYTVENFANHYALYPYRFGTKYSAGTMTVRLPNMQQAVCGSFDTGLNITAARSSDDNLSFKNICALLKVTVPAEVTDVTSISLSSRLPLAGDMKISFDGSGLPSMLPVSSSVGKEIVLDNGGQPLAPGNYYIVIAPGDHKFSMGIKTSSGKMYARTSDVRKVISANQIVNLGTLAPMEGRQFVLTNLPDAPVSLADTWKIGYENKGGGTVGFVSRDANIVTSVADGNIVFGKRPGVGIVNVTYDGLTFPVAFDVRAWYKDGSDKWILDTQGTPSAAFNASTTLWGESCHELVTDAAGKAYILRKEKIWPSPVTSPVLCVRVEDVADNGYARNIILNFSSNFNFNGTRFTGVVGDDSNTWVRKYRCSDGSSILVYDLSQQTVGSRMLPEDFHADGNLQFKYADVRNGSGTVKGLAVRFFGFRSYGSMEDMEKYLKEWSESTGISYMLADEEGGEDASEFDHPCALVNASDIARVKASVSKASASDPVYASYKHFCKNKYSQSSYKASPVEVLVRGDVTGTGVSSENYLNAARDAAAAYQLALRWQIGGERKYADAAVAVLNAWADKCRIITANDNNQYLCAGFQGYTFANAAELLRDYDGWAANDQNDFKIWLRDVWLAKNQWFIGTHGGSGNCNLHYWSNWELANLASMLAIGIYLEDKIVIEEVRRNFSEGAGSGCIDNMIPYDPVPDQDGHGMIAQCMESGRDQGHATLVISLCAELCQMAWNAGMDFWGMDDNKVLAMSQYTAKYNVCPDGSYICTTMPFTPYSYCPPGCGCAHQGHGQQHDKISESGRGKERAGWDLIYSHYKHEKHCKTDDLYYVKLFADQLRYTDGALTGDGGAGDSRYGATSAAFDQLGWGTMLFYKGE